jgi:hypothetical protein
MRGQRGHTVDDRTFSELAARMKCYQRIAEASNGNVPVRTGEVERGAQFTKVRQIPRMCVAAPIPGHRK